MRTLPPASGFDRQQRVEHLARRQLRVADRRGVQEVPLLADDVDRRGFVVAGHPDVVKKSAEAGDGVVEMGATIADVAPERDGDGRRERIWSSGHLVI